MLKKIRMVVGAFSLLALALPASAAPLAGNPSFEIAGPGGPADSASWTEFTGGAAGTMSVRDGGMPFAGAFAHHLAAVGEAGIGAVAGINQNSVADVGLASLQPGSALSAAFQWKGALGPGGVGFATLRILNGVGAIVASTGLTPLPDTGGAYAPVAMPGLIVPPFGPSPDDVYAAFLEISVNAGAFTGSSAHGWVDNVGIDGTLVPEPAALGLLGVTALLGVRRRR